MNIELDYLAQLLDKEPCRGAFFLLGENYFHQQDYAASVEVSRRGLQLYPEDLELRLLLGRSLVALNQLREAEETLLPVVEQVRRWGEVFAALAQIFQLRDRGPEAQEAETLYRLLQGSTASETSGPARPTTEAIPESSESKQRRGRTQVLYTLQKWQQALQAHKPE
ncbi:MAG: tetratricopeptide repeat protein [Desulfobacca sp.]|nr:tetratricopeptide repeat protein [Desulfobacca sp.]